MEPRGKRNEMSHVTEVLNEARLGCINTLDSIMRVRVPERFVCYRYAVDNELIIQHSQSIPRKTNNPFNQARTIRR